MRGWGLVISCWLPLLALASPQLNEFGYGLQIAIQDREAVQALPLHDAVYRRAVRADLGDLRVFNAAGERVPHLLRRPENPPPGVAERLTLPLFPLRSLSGGEEGHARIAVSTGPNGAFVAIAQDGTLRGGGEGDYIIDLGEARRHIERLHFNWGTAEQGFVQHLQLEGSDDLDHWRILLDAATLVDLSYGGEHLVRNTLSLPRNPGRYLRLSWTGERQVPPLQAVSASFSGPFHEEPRRWKAIPLTPGEEHQWLFEVPGHAPIDRLRLALPEQNSLIQIRLESRNGLKQGWVNRFSGPLYRLRINAADLEQQTISLSPTADRYWRLVMSRDDGGLGDTPPTLEVGWRPHHLLFIARGDGPFTLGFGNGSIEAAEPSLRVLIQRLKTTSASQWAQAEWQGAPFELRGEEALAVVTPLPWQKWLLWAVLLGAVVGLGWLAARLLRQVREG